MVGWRGAGSIMSRVRATRLMRPGGPDVRMPWTVPGLRRAGAVTRLLVVPQLSWSITEIG
jgi:hypothetical protein